jgi:hypothetical protein
MSTDQSTNQNEQQQHHVIKYILDKLENYAHKSHISRLIHASHFRRHLLRRSRHVSEIHSISEELVRQCIIQFFADVDQYVTQLHRLLYSQQFDDLIPLFSNANQKNCAWHTMQLKRARYLFPTKQQSTEKDLLINYYKYVREQLTPNHDVSNANREAQLRKCSFDLNLAYTQAECKGKEYLQNVIQNFRKRKTPDLDIVHEMIKLGKYMSSNSIIYMINSFNLG